ncbi:MAG: type II secretion system minor pseudopilin GspH [Gammaproteobacteria bacterium]|nr:type II secretion system minor pseudopilin GspH [Gammaproteobacteria bacterium]
MTLIEVLVVLILIAVITTSIALRLNLNPEKRMAEEVRRMNALVRLASEEALLQGRDLGISVDPDSYSFYMFDQLQQRWLSMETEKLFRTRTLPGKIRMDISVEESSVTWPDPEEDPDENPEDDADEEQIIPTPQILLLSSGEITPFDIYFEAEGVTAALQLHATPEGEREVIRHEFGL